MVFPPLLGPRAPERNPPIVPQYYQPSVFFITDITNGLTTTITTATDHNYVVGQQVRFLIPVTYGSVQLNNQIAYVDSIPSPTTFIVLIDSRFFDLFIPSPAYGPTKPQVIAIGDANSGCINSEGRLNNGTTIPGAFKDISPIKGTWLE